MRTLKYLLEDAFKHKARVNQLDFIVAFLQENVKNSIFVKLDSRYAYNLIEHSSYFGRALVLMKSVYGITNSVNLFVDDSTEWLIEAVFIQSRF